MPTYSSAELQNLYDAANRSVQKKKVVLYSLYCANQVTEHLKKTLSWLVIAESTLHIGEILKYLSRTFKNGASMHVYSCQPLKMLTNPSINLYVHALVFMRNLYQ